MKFIFSLITILTLSLTIRPCLAQDYLLEDTAEIASHKRKSSHVNFQKNKDASSDFSKATIIGYLFKPGANDPYRGIDDQILNYQGLSKCTESKVILDEVFHHTEGSEAIDFILYDYKDSSQVSKTKGQKRAIIPWDPNYDPGAGHMTVDARLQDLARTMNPQCLPSSFRFIYSGSKRYLETKTGDKAWE